MTLSELHELTDPARFDIGSLSDEVRADQACVVLLQAFRDQLLAEGVDPLQAGSLAHGADYFLREFIIGDRRENLLRLAPGRVRQFGGHWYIVRTVEPNRAELAAILAGVERFYAFLVGCGRVSLALHESVAAECRELEFYLRRIETFWAIEGDGFDAWRDLCPLPRGSA